MPHARLEHSELHYLRRGAGEPLLLIMGMSGNHLHWGEPFLSALERDFDLVAYDHRGVGYSSRSDGGFTIADLADDAAALMGELDWDSAHVLGISMGGMVAQELALRYPERVRTLGLGCTYAGGDGSALSDPSVVEALTEAMRSGDRQRAIRVGFELNVSATYAAGPGNYEAFSEIALRKPTAVSVIMEQMAAIGRHDTSSRLEQIKVPTLVVHGTEDRMLPASNAEAIAARIAGARLELLDGVGHLFFWEQPSRSAQLVCELAASPAQRV